MTWARAAASAVLLLAACSHVRIEPRDVEGSDFSGGAKLGSQGGEEGTYVFGLDEDKLVSWAVQFSLPPERANWRGGFGKHKMRTEWYSGEKLVKSDEVGDEELTHPRVVRSTPVSVFAPGKCRAKLLVDGVVVAEGSFEVREKSLAAELRARERALREEALENELERVRARFAFYEVGRTAEDRFLADEWVLPDALLRYDPTLAVTRCETNHGPDLGPPLDGGDVVTSYFLAIVQLKRGVFDTAGTLKWVKEFNPGGGRRDGHSRFSCGAYRPSLGDAPPVVVVRFRNRLLESVVWLNQ